MANLLNENIRGEGYRGLLNLGTIGSFLTSTFLNVTDGMGNASPLFLSNQSVAIGGTGLDGSLAIRSVLGTTALILGVRAGGWSNAVISGNDVMFQNNQTGYVFASGSTWIDPLARVHVRGDGTNQIARFENSTATNAITINSNGNTITGSGALGSAIISWANTDRILFTSGIGSAGVSSFSFTNSGTYAASTSTPNLMALTATFGNAVIGSVNPRLLNINYTLNYTSAQTGTATGIFLNATETALNGMTHNLMDLQINGVSRFRVLNNGNAIARSFLSSTLGTEFGWSNGSFISCVSNGNIILYNNNYSGFGLLQFGGAGATRPALKQNSASLEVRLADDSGYAAIQSLYQRFGSGSPEGVVTAPVGTIYHRTDGGANTSLYVKESGISNTGWVVK